MLKIAATSAAVMLFSKPEHYKSKVAERYLSLLDFSEGKALSDQFTHLAELLHSGTTLRKLRVQKLADQYLSENPTAQVVSLGAGLDPLSPDLAACYPESSVYDVDMSSMDLKAQINQAAGGPSMQFVTANLMNPEEMRENLIQHGWDPESPTLVIAEGIAYYIPKSDFVVALSAVRTDGGGLIFEYSIPDDHLDDPVNNDTIRTFFRDWAKIAGMTVPMRRYSIEEVHAIAEKLGGSIATTLHEYHAAQESGKYTYLFPTLDSGVIRVSLIEF